jgi:hypothetical protein
LPFFSFFVYPSYSEVLLPVAVAGCGSTSSSQFGSIAVAIFFYEQNELELSEQMRQSGTANPAKERANRTGGCFRLSSRSSLE